jgi:hypothetical protein
LTEISENFVIFDAMIAYVSKTFTMKLLPVLFLAAFALASCRNEEISPPVKQTYFPLRAGMFYIYKTDSVVYQGNKNKPDTIHFLLKDSVISEFKDLTGQTVYRIDEYRRNNQTGNWTIVKVFTRSVNNVEAFEVDRGPKVVKMVFPVATGASWIPDRYNTADTSGARAVFTEVGKPYVASNLSYLSTALVEILNDSNLVQMDKYYERYALDVGLIYVNRDAVYTQIIEWPQGGGADTSYFGFRYHQTLTNYGPR